MQNDKYIVESFCTAVYPFSNHSLVLGTFNNMISTESSNIQRNDSKEDN